MKSSSNIVVKITNQGNKDYTKRVNVETLMFLSGSQSVKSLEVIDWNINKKQNEIEYRKVA